MTSDIYTIVEPKTASVPILLSVPHCGIEFPEEIRGQFVQSKIAAPDDTDWNLDRLYDFAPSLGVTTIVPRYSRWVIDLNREPESKPLYDDGRIITPLCPAIDFNDEAIYQDSRAEVDAAEVRERLVRYFDPYHSKIDQILTGFVEKFGIALFWDGHSIRRSVPTIQAEDFPDFILGNNDGLSAGQNIIDVALSALCSQDFSISHNTPFKGGYLTRSKGKPEHNVHALQLEMSKDLYMVRDETEYSESKAISVKQHLKGVFEGIIEVLPSKRA